jgi:hypothetical protein
LRMFVGRRISVTELAHVFCFSRIWKITPFGLA